MKSGHKLASELIGKHGKDRYPTVELTMMKLVEELGELSSEILSDKSAKATADEYADVGICLYQLGNKLGLDLIECMKTKISNDHREFS